jgi:hypothetical protein
MLHYITVQYLGSCGLEGEWSSLNIGPDASLKEQCHETDIFLGLNI